MSFKKKALPFIHSLGLVDSALTDALISGLANGSEAFKLVGTYVTSPLNWFASTARLLVCVLKVDHLILAPGRSSRAQRLNIRA